MQLSGAEHAHLMQLWRAVVTVKDALQLQLDEAAEIGRNRPATKAVTEELFNTIHGR
jgi:hypothetical protein